MVDDHGLGANKPMNLQHKIAKALGFFNGKPACGLIKHNEPGLAHHAACNIGQPALIARQGGSNLVGAVRQTDDVQHLHRLGAFGMGTSQ